MAANQEQIEARLCDYVEGTLTDAERTDIEKHLAQNPQHRKLIGELLKTKNLVRQLPRVKAPGDVSETLQGQLERSVLLGNMPDEMPDTAMRIGFGARLRAIAAVLFLAVGLGAVMVYMLRNTRTLPELATLPPKTESPGASTSVGTEAMGDLAAAPSVASSTGDADVAGGARREIAGAPPEAGKPAAESPAAAVAPSASVPAPVESAAPVVANAFAPDQASGGAAQDAAVALNDAFLGSTLADRMKLAAGTNMFECYVANASRKDVAGYLENNQISYTIEPAPEPLTLAPDQVVRGARFNNDIGRLAALNGAVPPEHDRESRNSSAGGTPMLGPNPTTAPGESMDRAAAATGAGELRAGGEVKEEGTSAAGLSEMPVVGQKKLEDKSVSEAQRTQQLVFNCPNLTQEQAATLRSNFTRSGQLAKQQLQQNIDSLDRQAGVAVRLPVQKSKGAGVAGDADQKHLPTTEPADAFSSSAVASVTSPATQPALEFPSTQPSRSARAQESQLAAAPATIPTDQRVDVFIVVDAPPTELPAPARLPAVRSSDAPTTSPTTAATTAPSDP